MTYSQFLAPAHGLDAAAHSLALDPANIFAISVHIVFTMVFSVVAWFLGVISTRTNSLKFLKSIKWLHQSALPDVWRIDFRNDHIPPLPFYFVELEIYKYITKRLASGSAGVYVHWSIPHGGKSICGKAVAHEIRKQGRYE